MLLVLLCAGEDPSGDVSPTGTTDTPTDTEPPCDQDPDYPLVCAH